ncbi:alpha/beta fold hydrolase [Arthrobacter sp.]|uniref:alpha/beta hydrolase n=1 Tax=Arthrobacter sp. TaxID=1667 RepID=UPI0033973CCC
MPSDIKPTFLLVHGAWHGSWCWSSLQAILESHGFNVVTVDLPSVNGLDPLAHTMSDDAAAVGAAVEGIDGPVVVVAHSYGGVPVTQGGAAPHVLHIVYISAFVLDIGESLLGSLGGERPDWWALDGQLASAGTPDYPARDLFFGDVDAPAAEEAVARLLPQNASAFSEELTAAAWKSVPSTFIVTEQDAIFPVEAQEALATRAGSAVLRMDTSHSPFLSQPKRLAELLEDVAVRSMVRSPAEELEARS